MEDIDFEALYADGVPRPPPGYGRGTDPPDWYRPDTFTGRRYELYRLRSALWEVLLNRMASPD